MTARVRIEQRVGDGPSRVTLSVELESDFVQVKGLTECALDIIDRAGIEPPEPGVEQAAGPRALP